MCYIYSQSPYHRSISFLIPGFYSLLWMKTSRNARKQTARSDYLGCFDFILYSFLTMLNTPSLYVKKKNPKC